MSGIRTGTVASADGTVIGFDQSGAGPAVILVQGALMNRSDPRPVEDDQGSVGRVDLSGRHWAGRHFAGRHLAGPTRHSASQ